MKKKLLCLFGIMIALVVGGVRSNIIEQEQSLFVISTSSGNVLSACRNGKDWTEEYIRLQDQTERTVAEYLGVKKEMLEFSGYTLLQRDGISDGSTIDIIQNQTKYTFICDIEGKILSVKETRKAYSVE